MDTNKILRFSIESGALMLKSGGETYRTEDTMVRILKKHNFKSIEVFSTTTGIFASVIDGSGDIVTMVRRITERTTNLEKIALVNNLSRNFVQENITLDEAIAELDVIDNTPSLPNFVKYFASAFSCASFSYIFGGSFYDAIVAFLSGFIIYVCLTRISKSGRLSSSIVTVMVSVVAAITVVIISKIMGNPSYDKSIIGTLMPLVPGLGLTNAVRDIIDGDYISGTSRIVDALITAVCIAAGVAIGLGFTMMAEGGLALWL